MNRVSSYQSEVRINRIMPLMKLIKLIIIIIYRLYFNIYMFMGIRKGDCA